MRLLLKNLLSIDWILVIPIILLLLLGLITNYPAEGFSYDSLFFRQVIHIGIAIPMLFLCSFFPTHLLRGRIVSVVLYSLVLLVLVLLLLFAPTINGAQSWFVFGAFAVQPVDFVKIVLIIVLAQFISSRHTRLHHRKTIFLSLLLALPPLVLVMQQPDLGSSVVLIALWVGMILVSGIQKKIFVMLMAFAIISLSLGFQFLKDYQQERIVAFLTPQIDIQDSGYTANQAKIAIGSGEITGKGIFEGTQSRLDFLPLHQSDFVFASFAEKWGFVGVVILFSLFAVLGVRLLHHALRGRTRFESLFIIGAFVMIFSHLLLHIGVNVGVVPVTGITLSFMSYGGSHILAEAVILGLVLSMVRGGHLRIGYNR